MSWKRNSKDIILFQLREEYIEPDYGNTIVHSPTSDYAFVENKKSDEILSEINFPVDDENKKFTNIAEYVNQENHQARLKSALRQSASSAISYV